ncbi:MAG: TetR/AcrR family transcriptional regulator [Ilumatobacter sp.]
MTADERALTKKGETTRERIVAAARSMLLDRGYDGLVLRELAESLDIKLGNLQYYFATREDLALHVLSLEGARDALLIEDSRETCDPHDALRLVVRDMVVRYRGESGRLLLMISALAQHHEAFRTLYSDSYAGFYPPFEALIGAVNPELSPGETAMRARLINALVEGSSFQVLVDDLDAYIDRVVAEAEAIARRQR